MVKFVALIGLLSCPPSGYAEGLELGGRFGLGVSVSVMNLGIGPSAEFWLTNHIGILGTIGITGPFRSYAVRGNYLFFSPDRYADASISPYVSAGYAHIKLGDFEDVHQSGFEVCGGLMVGFNRHLYVRGELGYANITFSDEYTEDSSWSQLTMGGGISYMF
ncbi:hypothetical protein JXO59_05630 [candidate division KSB1 bacterium]|nr:hypothetical protein [candidate division KSB1 bacterium]